MNIETIERSPFIINFPSELKKFVHDSLNRYENRIHYLTYLFDEQLVDIKVSIFNNKDDFMNYIKSISNNPLPLNWASGCCYNNEIQISINTDNPDILKFKTNILTHELVHLYFNNFIYKKYHIKRMRWFDESYASYIDGKIEQRTNQAIREKATNLENLKDFDMNKLSSLNELDKASTNAYDMFLLIGKYIFDNNLEKSYINDLINNYQSVVEIGKNILKNAIEHVLND